jgi:hypothetical protein
VSQAIVDSFSIYDKNQIPLNAAIFLRFPAMFSIFPKMSAKQVQQIKCSLLCDDT